MSTAYEKAYNHTVAGMKVAKKVADDGGAAPTDDDFEAKRLTNCRNYQTTVGCGWATFCLTLPKKYKKEDIADLREWLDIIDWQLERLEEQGD